MGVDFESIKEIILNVPLFGAMSEEEIKSILEMFDEESFKEGEVIIKEGDSPKNIYIIKSGEVKILKDGIELIKLKLGDSFGEVEIIGIMRNLATCVAITDCEFIVLPKKALYTLQKTAPSFFVRFLLNISRECCRRLANADNYITNNQNYNDETDGDYY
ncbi:MAG: cyclic nucleotide-binding domain-containing protein [Fusobacteriaceae bacterium]